MKLINVATADTTRPRPTSSSAFWCSRRSIAVATMTAAATTIMPPSSPLEKYSAFACPYGCSSSAGRAATVNAANATHAATTLTSDSSASDKSPSEPVIQKASPLRRMTTIDVATDSQAKRTSDTGRAFIAGRYKRTRSPDAFALRPEAYPTTCAPGCRPSRIIEGTSVCCASACRYLSRPAAAKIKSAISFECVTRERCPASSSTVVAFIRAARNRSRSGEIV